MADRPFSIFVAVGTESLRDRALNATRKSLLPDPDALVIKMFRALTRAYPGFGYEAYLDLTIPEFGGLMGLDEVPPEQDPDYVRAQEELAKKRGPSPDRKG